MMYTYRNKKTGATFETPCRCSGDEWELVKNTKKPRETVKQSEEDT